VLSKLTPPGNASKEKQATLNDQLTINAFDESHLSQPIKTQETRS
jgi:hypothetical protein